MSVSVVLFLVLCLGAFVATNVTAEVDPTSYQRGSTGPLQYCRTPDLPFLDASESGPGVVSDTITIPLTLTNAISDVNVLIEASHTRVGDIVFALEHITTGMTITDTGTTTVTLIARPGYPEYPLGCGADDIVATLNDEAGSPVENACAASDPAIAGEFTPNEPLSVFDDQSLPGQWRLTITDTLPDRTGTLDKWCILPTIMIKLNMYLPTTFHDRFFAPTPTAMPTPTLTPTQIPCLTEEQEPNNTASEAQSHLPLCQGTTIMGRLPDGDNDDLYQMDVSAQSRVVIDLTAVPAGTDYNLYLYSYDQSLTLVDYSGELGTSDEHIEVDLAPGTYYVRVYPFQGRSNEPYNLTWR